MRQFGNLTRLPSRKVNDFGGFSELPFFVEISQEIDAAGDQRDAGFVAVPSLNR